MELKKYKLGELTQVTRGASLGGEYYATQGNYIRLTCGNFDYRNNCFKENQSKDNIYYVGDFKEEFLLDKGDIITPLTEQAIGLLGSTARIPESGKYIQSQDIAKIDCNESLLDKNFAFYLISSACVKQQLSAAAQQTKIRHTSPDKIKDCTVWIPSLDVQKRIGRILTDIDNKIAINRQINDNLEAMAKQLYDYWFVQFDFPNEDGKPYKSSGGAMVWNEKLKREIPTSFDVKSLSEIIEVKDGTHDSPKPQDNGYFLLTSKHLTERGLDYTSAYKISKEDYESINKRSKVDTNDILFSMIGTIGNSYFVEETNINFAIKNMALFKTSAKRWFSEYLYLYLSSCDYKHYEGNSLSGSIQKFVSLRTLRDMPILYHEDIIKVFAKEVRNIITMMVNLRKENIELTKQRDELLPLLMNGQASVNYHLSAKVYPLPTAYKKAMPIVANQIKVPWKTCMTSGKVPWKTCVVPRISYDSSYYCCLDCNYFLSNYLTIAAFSR